MNHTANYLIVQHVSDLFRRETRNVGVFVRLNEQTKARFFGEGNPGEIDKRRIRVLPFPGAYAQWIRYWRRIMQRKPDVAWDEVKKTAHDHYQIIDGGSVDGIGADGIDDVLNYLYAALVSEGGIAAAMGAPDEAIAAVRLADAVEDELRKQHLLADAGPIFAETIKHPVLRDTPVEGANATHLLSFVQRNGHDIVMEPIDLAVKRDRTRMKERAGWASRVFEDIKAKNKDTETIALISATTEEEKEEGAQYALKLLLPYATEIINWQSAKDQQRFISARSAIAKSK